MSDYERGLRDGGRGREAEFWAAFMGWPVALVLAARIAGWF